MCHAEGELLDPGLPILSKDGVAFQCIVTVFLTHSRAEQEASEGAGHPEAQGAPFPARSEPGRDGINTPFTISIS